MHSGRCNQTKSLLLLRSRLDRVEKITLRACPPFAGTTESDGKSGDVLVYLLNRWENVLSVGASSPEIRRARETLAEGDQTSVTQLAVHVYPELHRGS